MSYDLILKTARRRQFQQPERDLLRTYVNQSEILGRCEILDFVGEGTSHLYTVCLTFDDASVEEAFAELKAVAKEFRLELHDPQAGTDVDLKSDDKLPAMY
jgi:hypothetical protein